ncbi:hypothetical protein GE21DRAFT_1335 [Neurospora crassa]|uniref:Uncharacterized protein n=1 Tax=Neurospora crassa (strain ATCC 24698 / 74-OR23-1A / CBS 708.71 / DSM 1257 / FGSC 987) TaxID=367110 RepID=Q7SEF3_NEUCR|nr:hypothetical protein NCU03275 [Neurospora crassa OR74A]EAA35192.2 hypothetical protein NCU03275 [Neurospora crassa OR74A]KHE79880.1 hypothetical protein GE21DRAFT_1335 [Neurospora crassa]|eukprot:XP_964428.2 hypothetical protein NCU03275 [Neurospora crassa OR74A]
MVCHLVDMSEEGEKKSTSPTYGVFTVLKDAAALGPAQEMSDGTYPAHASWCQFGVCWSTMRSVQGLPCVPSVLRMATRRLDCVIFQLFQGHYLGHSIRLVLAAADTWLL